MSLPSGTRYRWKKNKDGSKVRLAFHKGKVIEVKKEDGVAKKVKYARKQR